MVYYKKVWSSIEIDLSFLDWYSNGSHIATKYSNRAIIIACIEEVLKIALSNLVNLRAWCRHTYQE